MIKMVGGFHGWLIPEHRATFRIFATSLSHLLEMFGVTTALVIENAIYEAGGFLMA